MAEAELLARIEQHRGAVVAEMRDVIGQSDDGLFAWMRYHLGWENAAGEPVEARSGKMLRPLALLLATDLVGRRHRLGSAGRRGDRAGAQLFAASRRHRGP